MAVDFMTTSFLKSPSPSSLSPPTLATLGSVQFQPFLARLICFSEIPSVPSFMCTILNFIFMSFAGRASGVFPIFHSPSHSLYSSLVDPVLIYSFKIIGFVLFPWIGLVSFSFWKFWHILWFLFSKIVSFSQFPIDN